MTEIKLLGRILRVRKFLKIKRYFFKNWNKEIHLWVKPYKNGCCCPKCLRRSPIIRQMPTERIWRDIRICGFNIYFHYAAREIVCPTHGRIQEDIPWAAAYAQATFRFEALVLQYCQVMPQQDAAHILSVSPSTLSGILHRAIERIRVNHKIRGLRTIGVDEISYHKGKKYATIVYDLDRCRVLWVGKGKGRETIDTFFKTKLSPFQRKQIKFASCDMSQAYLGALKYWCTNAKIVLDRFHIAKALNSAIDEVRKEEWRNLKGTEEGKSIKGIRWLLYRHSSNRSKLQTRVLNSLRKSNRRIWRAWILKDEFEQFWEYTYVGAAKSFLKKWTKSALLSRLEPVRKFVKTLRNHIENIVTFLETRLTNAVAEGINRLIKIVKNRASGFANLECFSDMIFLTVGDMDIPAQIPKKFHTI